MSLLEIRLENWACEKAEVLGWIPIKLNNRSSNGWPDRMFIKYEDVFFVEFKRESEVPRKLQKYRIKTLVKMGHRVYIADTKEDWLDISKYESGGCVGAPPLSRVGCGEDGFQWRGGTFI